MRENNFSATAKGADFFICDIEYTNETGRFDLIAAHWPSSSSHRKDNRNAGLSFIEMKYMNKSMMNSSGICAHIQDLAYYFNENQDHFLALKEEMRYIFNQKLELGLIDNQKPIECFDDKNPDVILILANHDPDSAILFHELMKIENMKASLPFALKFAVSNFMGYGLYDQNIYGLDEFTKKFSNQIFSNHYNESELVILRITLPSRVHEY